MKYPFPIVMRITKGLAQNLFLLTPTKVVPIDSASNSKDNGGPPKVIGPKVSQRHSGD